VTGTAAQRSVLREERKVVPGGDYGMGARFRVDREPPSVDVSEEGSGIDR
jgi:hypothetical protein